MLDALETRQHQTTWGDTLEGISQMYYGDRQYAIVIYRANDQALNDPNHLNPGQWLTIPYIEPGTRVIS